jgi:hypothetical protein
MLLLVAMSSTLAYFRTFPVEAQSGMFIDLYGGAVNDYLGPLISTYNSSQYGPNWQFPAPYGGQGPNAPMDLVEPQSLVYLWANVTYTNSSVSSKNVAFEIQEPDGTVYAKYTAYSDANGVAGVTFRMPWSSTNPESLFGTWTVTATVSIADQLAQDTTQFQYDYLVQIWKVTTDAFQYAHGQPVSITINYGSCAIQTYPVLFVTSIVDSLGVTVGVATVSTKIGNATGVFNEYTNWTLTVALQIPEWAYVGTATVYTSGFDKEPTQGGVAITPEYVGPTIEIVITALPEALVTFNQVGVSSDFTGTVVTVDNLSYSSTQLPVSFSWSLGSTHSFAFQSPLVVEAGNKQYVWTGTTGLSNQQSGSIIVTTSGTIIGNYKTQYYLTVTSAYDSPVPSSGWFDSGTGITESVTSPVSGGSGTQYVCTGWSGGGSVPIIGTGSSVTFTINAPSTITWNWKTQYQVMFNVSGVGSDFTGTVVTVDGVDYTLSTLPVSFLWDSGSSHTFAFYSSLMVSSSKQYSWQSTLGLSNLQSGALNVTASGSIVGNYVIKTPTFRVPLWLFSAFTLASGILGALVLLLFLAVLRKQRRRKQRGRPSYAIIVHPHV